MNGIIDIGNTAVKWALFEGEQMLENGRTTYGDWTPIQRMHEKFPGTNWLLSSVREQPSPTELGFAYERMENSSLPVTIRYSTPSSLGKDRIAAVCGALALFPGQACLVIDAGTCITYDFLDATGIYHGGSISPGIHMRLKAMHEFTGKLPLVEWEVPEGYIGDSTLNSMLQGVKQGVLGEAGRQIALYEAENPGIRVIVSGGDTDFFVENLKKGIFAAPFLVLTGLNKILQHKQSLNA